MLQAASEMSAYFTPASGKELGQGDKQIDMKSSVKELSLLVGKVNQSISQFRRNLVKPSLSPKFAKLVKKVE